MTLRSLWPALALAAALFTSCSSGPTPEGSAQPLAEASATQEAGDQEPSPSPTPTALTLAETVPDGTWDGPEEVVEVGGAAKSWWKPVPKKGDLTKAGNPWTFTSSCTATECAGKITRADDAKDKVPARNFTWDGKALKITREPQRGSEKCYYDDGSVAPEKWSWQRTWTYDVSVETDTQGRVVKIDSEVTIRMKDTTKSSVACGTKLKPAHEVLVGTIEPT